MNSILSKPFFEKIVGWWEGLADKDRRTLTLASPLILMLVLYLAVIQPVLAHYYGTKASRAQLSDSLIWLYENAALVERMENRCSRERLTSKGNDSLSNFVKNIARRSGSTAQVRVLNSQELDVNFNRISGTRAIALMQSYVCHGFELSSLKMQRNKVDTNEIEFSMRLRANPLLEDGSV